MLGSKAHCDKVILDSYVSSKLFLVLRTFKLMITFSEKKLYTDSISAKRKIKSKGEATDDYKTYCIQGGVKH